MRGRTLVLTLLGGCAALPPGGTDTSDTGPAGDTGGAAVPFDALACLDDPTCTHPLVVAHRGAGPSTPENSLAGLHAAADAGVPLVELDVRPTSDEVLVVMHDADVDRTTDGTGDVSTFTAEAFAALELEDGSAPPTFAAMLAAAKARGIALYVDVKTDRMDLIVAEIAAAEAHDVVLVRDDVASLVRAAALDPTLRWLAATDDVAAVDAAIEALPGLQWVELTDVAPDPDFVSAATERGLRVQQDAFLGDLAWYTGESTDGWQGFLDAGVRMPQTDLAAVLVGVVGD